jgi:hypothetical protein
MSEARKNRKGLSRSSGECGCGQANWKRPHRHAGRLPKRVGNGRRHRRHTRLTGTGRRFRILDEDEFAVNTRRFGYTETVLSGARHAVEELTAMIRGRNFPFEFAGMEDGEEE